MRSLLVLILTILLALCSGKGEQSDPQLRIGNYQTEDGYSVVQLKENQEFMFDRYIALNYVPSGQYRVEGNRLILEAADGEVYTFLIEDDCLILESGAMETPEAGSRYYYMGKMEANAGEKPAAAETSAKDTEETAVCYQMEMPETLEEPMSDIFLPSLCLNEEERTFSFGYDLLSSYLPYGTYEIEDGILTARTGDGKYQYLFRVMEDGSLAFIEEGSSEVRLTDIRLGIPVEDGAKFKRQ